MAFVKINTRKTIVSGVFNKIEFDTLMAQKKYPFLINCRNEFIDDTHYDCSRYNFSFDMDFYYKSKLSFESQYLITPNHGFSFEVFLKFCADYVDPNFSH